MWTVVRRRLRDMALGEPKLHLCVKGTVCDSGEAFEMAPLCSTANQCTPLYWVQGSSLFIGWKCLLYCLSHGFCVFLIYKDRSEFCFYFPIVCEQNRSDLKIKGIFQLNNDFMLWSPEKSDQKNVTFCMKVSEFLSVMFTWWVYAKVSVWSEVGGVWVEM